MHVTSLARMLLNSLRRHQLVRVEARLFVCVIVWWIWTLRLLVAVSTSAGAFSTSTRNCPASRCAAWRAIASCVIIGAVLGAVYTVQGVVLTPVETQGPL